MYLIWINNCKIYQPNIKWSCKQLKNNYNSNYKKKFKSKPKFNNKITWKILKLINFKIISNNNNRS